ncbi:MAG: AraC family transcriptional regulator [Bdellovibrionales bacterium]
MGDVHNPFEGVEIDRVFLSRAELSAPWGIDMPAMGNMLLFHLVVEGEAWIKFPKQKKAHKISQGQLSLIPNGRDHYFFDGDCKTMTPLFDIHRDEITSQYEILKHGGEGEESLTLCGAVKLNHPLSQLLLKGLPDIVIVQEWDESERIWTENTFQFLFQEAKRQAFASKEIIMNLSEVLVFQCMRNWFNQNEEGQPLIKAMSDERMTRLINEILKTPSKRWTTLEMASSAGMSRSAFSERFTKLFYVSPSDFVRGIKLDLAEKLFRVENLSIGEVSDRLGYESEAAFARAYKRVKGISPGKIKGKIQPGF